MWKLYRSSSVFCLTFALCWLYTSFLLFTSEQLHSSSKGLKDRSSFLHQGSYFHSFSLSDSNNDIVLPHTIIAGCGSTWQPARQATVCLEAAITTPQEVSNVASDAWVNPSVTLSNSLTLFFHAGFQAPVCIPATSPSRERAFTLNPGTVDNLVLHSAAKD